MIERCLLQPVLATPPSSVAPFPLQARIAVTSNGSDLSARVIQLLNQQGYSNTTLADEIPADCDVAIVLDGLRIFSDQQQAILINTQIFQQVQRIAARFSEHGGWLFTAQDTGGVFGLSAMHTWQPWSAGITGLVKTAALEWPKAHCRTLDVQIADQTTQCLAERIVREILIESQDVERGLLADGRRITLQTTAGTLPKQVSSSSSRYPWFHQSELIKSADTLPLILITGGARGVTSACIIALAQRAPLRLLLLGRTALTEEPTFCQSAADESALKHALFSHYQAQNQAVTPKQINQQVATILANREIQATLAALQATGSQVHYLPVDISDEQNLTNALADVRQQWGDIHGVIHGAGVLADKRIVEKTAEQFASVFNTKVMGLKNILAATAQDPLQLIVLFSSVAARFGNPGQCDYAMANEVLNKVAQQQQRLRKHCVVKSINWGPWEGGMVTPQLKQLFKERGVALVSMQEGTQRFVAECEVSGNENNAPMSTAVEVVIGGTLNPSTQPAAVPASNMTSRPTEIATPAVAPSTQQVTISIDVNSHPYLTSHVIQGIPVIPACLVMEWFMRAAKAHYPDITRVTCQHFRVLRGIRLTEFYQQPQQFVVTARSQPDQPQQLHISLHAPDKPLPAYYSAEMTLTTDATVAPIAFDATTASAWPHTLQEIYDPHSNPLALFHGQHFQAISKLQSVSDYGGVAEIKGVYAMQWPDDWQLDLVAIDCAFQLLWLWGARMLGKPSLPMAVGSLRVFSQPPRDATLTCIFSSQLSGNNKTLSMVNLLDQSGKLYAEMQDVEMVFYDIKVDNRIEIVSV